jgi:transposase
MVYYDMIKGISKFDIRLKIVERATKIGISQTAMEFKTTRLTVRKWVTRYKEKGLCGLEEHSRAPKHIPHKTPKRIEKRVIELRQTHPAWGPERLKMHYDISVSTKAIGRIIRQAGLVKKKKRKWREQRDLRELKKSLNPCELIQVDTKDLVDIEKYWPQMRSLKLPRYEFTARDVRTGGEWHAYGMTKDSTNSAIFAIYLLTQLQHYGVDINDISIQTDNGSEFIGNVSKKKGVSGFVRVLQELKVEHARIPPRSPTWQSDVESFHKLVEDEFYDLEDYRNLDEFIAKAYAYELYFNFKRKNRYRGSKTPIEILKECGSSTSAQVFNLPPIILDDFIDDFIKWINIEGGGHHVPTSVNFTRNFY